MPAPSVDSRYLRSAAGVIGLVILAAALVVLAVGWFGDVPQLRAPIPGSATMKANTAVAIIGVGASLALTAWGRARVVAVSFASVTLVIGLVTTFEYLLGSSATWFDQVLIVDPGPSTYPGRPGVNTGVSFILLGTALALQALERAPLTAQTCAAAAGIIAYLALLGYVMVSPVFPSATNQWTQMGIHTAAAVGLAAIGAIIVRPQQGWAAEANSLHAGGRLARVMVPVILLTGVIGAISVHALDLLQVPSPIPIQIVLAVLIILMLVVVAFLSSRMNHLDREQTRQRLVAMALDSAIEGVLVVSRDGHIEAANETMAAMTGMAQADLVGRNVDEFVPSGLRSRHGQMRDGYWRDPQPLKLGADRDITLVDVNGRSHPVEIGLSPIDAAAGPVAVVATVRDIGELVRANQELEQFAYVASHDLRAPLRSIGGFSDLLAASFDQGQLDDDQQDCLNEIGDGVRRMNALIDALLEYSRIGRTDTGLTTTPVRAQVEAVVDLFRERVDAHDVMISLDIPPTLEWTVAEHLMASALANVVDNSLKYRSPERPLTLAISGERGPSGVTVRIRDNGTGIAPEQLGRATQMFQRLSLTDSGLGIGLASVQRIVDHHHGDLHLTSDGRTFTEVAITLPDPTPHR